MNSIYCNKLSIPVWLQTILVALFLDVKCVNQILIAYGIPEDSGIMAILYISVVGGILLLSYIQKGGLNPKLSTSASYTLVYLLFLFTVTILLLQKPYTSTSYFSVFTICAFLIPFYANIDVRLLLKTIMFFPVLGLFKSSAIFVYVTEWNEWISIGLSYAYFVPIVATIVYLFTYFRDERFLQKILTILFSIVNIYYLFMLFQFGSRGPIVFLILLAIFLYCVKHDSLDDRVKINKGRSIFSIIILLVVFAFYNSILNLIQAFLQNNNISSHVIDKFITLSEEGDVMNGRDVISRVALNGFLDKPIFGNGFDQFFANTTYIYPHNVFLQILYDGGLIMTFIVIIPAIVLSKRKIKECSHDFFSCFVFLLFAGVVGGMFSEDLWKMPVFWLFLGFVFSDSFIISSNTIINE